MYEKIIKLFITLVLFNISIISVNASSNPYPKYEQSAFGGQIINCTWYAWQQEKDNMGVELPLWTNVQTWYSKAQRAGYSVGKEPKANSIMVWNYGEGFGGHVSYVTSVNGTTVTYNEGGSPMTESGINTDSMTLDMMSSFLVGFIYLDNVPTKSPALEQKTNTTQPKIESIPKEQPKVEEKKSSNNYLSDLKISGVELTFNKEVLEYNIEVENEIEEITITSLVEDSKAIVVGNNIYKLDEGPNNFVITVTAEDTTTREYKVNIYRKEAIKVEEEPKEEIKEESPTDVEKKPKYSKKAIILISLGIASLVVIVFIIGYAIYTKKRNKKDKESAKC